MIQHDDATRAQVNAARPHFSTWLSANAGSGKTRVLTDRVARLLLAQVPPERILCLTYTKAAAAEMQNRLFKRLGKWAMLDNEKLQAALQELGEEGAIDIEALRKARTLFAAAIEAPGGLKIQTIHSFCSTILRRFPLEANVSPQFAEMEERASDLLREEIIEDMASGDEAAMIMDLATVTGAYDLTALSGEIVGQRTAMITPPTDTAIYGAFDLDPNTTPETIASSVFMGGEGGVLAALIPALNGSSVNDVKLAAKLSLVTTLDAKSLSALEGAFLTADGRSKAGKIPAKKAQKDFIAHQSALDAWIERIEAARASRLKLAAVQKTLHLNRFAAAFLKRYEARKQAHGWLDFDDLILKTRDLLANSEMAQWVLYKLDGGIDHILVDEAQDTSPAQWDVIERLTSEIIAGEGARGEVPRAIFVVGDKKQSIYSFQGADPREFDRMHGEFDERLHPTNSPLVPAELLYSFRSASCILELVDQTFEGHAAAGFDSSIHLAFDGGPPGRIDIWPAIPKAEKADNDADWSDTVDKLGENDEIVLMARRIAGEIKRMTGRDGGKPEPIYDQKLKAFRPVRAGDILILVQRRSDLFEEIIRECKVAELPIAGADRLKVGAEMAVRDLQALLSFLATPEDDYALAVVLKSPLFGWSEKQLFDVANDRGSRFLWQELRGQKGQHPDVLRVLEDLRSQADFLRPYDLIERVLTRHNGRKHFIGRLGREAEDGIDALLAQALSFERSRIPSLTGFLTWMEKDDLTIKRQLSQDRDEIRVMTVHGSKGLEAPIVIMPETQKRQSPKGGSLIKIDDLVAWSVRKEDAPQAVHDAKAQREERQAEERMRLLYVAMTRAEKWLILGAAGGVGKTAEESWYGMVNAAARTRPHVDHDFGFGTGLRIEPVPWGDVNTQPARAAVTPIQNLEPFFLNPAPQVIATPDTLSPSNLGGAKALPSEQGLDEDAAKLRGTRIHLLLEHFSETPPDSWQNIANALLGDITDLSDLIVEAKRVVMNPDLRFLFAKGSLSEVPITAILPEFENTPLHGIVDRLIVNKTDVWVVDFKTNIAVPQYMGKCPEGLLRQMGAYHAALTQIYPEKRIRPAIVWTRDASLMELSIDHMKDALHRASESMQLDGVTPNT
ncbi:double-strand break repair helicase AddA [Planktotalea sp.]|uniref:double-strand break repair helicase AddA n=1 Tax=Planktotalea sp. TaxID=2029877 RepID=UPI0025D4ED41|nr:double-strand break repair helicase AddA [Planktotalea sp.]